MIFNNSNEPFKVTDINSNYEINPELKEHIVIAEKLNELDAVIATELKMELKKVGSPSWARLPPKYIPFGL